MENGPFIDGLPIKNGDFPCYVKQPDGISICTVDVWLLMCCILGVLCGDTFSNSARRSFAVFSGLGWLRYNSLYSAWSGEDILEL
jgi:hypothetical protein